MRPGFEDRLDEADRAADEAGLVLAREARALGEHGVGAGERLGDAPGLGASRDRRVDAPALAAVAALMVEDERRALAANRMPRAPAVARQALRHPLGQRQRMRLVVERAFLEGTDK